MTAPVDRKRHQPQFQPPAPKPTALTIAEIEAGRTPAGGWTKKQLAEWGVPWPPPKGWKRRLLDAAPDAPPLQFGDVMLARVTIRRSDTEDVYDVALTDIIGGSPYTLYTLHRDELFTP